MIDFTKPVRYADGSTPQEVLTSGRELRLAAPGTAAVVDGNYYRADGTHVYGFHKAVEQVPVTFDPAKPVQTRDGREARIIATDCQGTFPIAAEVRRIGGVGWHVTTFTASGGFGPHGEGSSDLVNVEPTKTLYVSLGNAYSVAANGDRALPKARDEDLYDCGVLKVVQQGDKLISAELVAK